MVSAYKFLAGMKAVNEKNDRSFKGIPVMLWSNPGMGKTSMIESLGVMKNLPTFVKSANKLTDVEIMGLPYITDPLGETRKNIDTLDKILTRMEYWKMDTEPWKVLFLSQVDHFREQLLKGVEKTVRYSTPKYIQVLNASKYGVLMFDELTTAPESIQTMLLTVIQDCSFGEFSIPLTTFRVAAGNYGNVIGTKNMSLALMNRFAHFHVDIDPKETADGLESGWTNREEPVVNTDSEDIFKKEIYYIHQVALFWMSHVDLINNMPEDVIDKKDVAYPTQRSWTSVARALSILDGNDDEYQKCIITSLVGDIAGNMFWQWLKEHKKVYTVDLLKYIGKEDTFFLDNPDKHDQVYQCIKTLMFSLERDPEKYADLFVRIINVLHNKVKKYGNYIAYDNFIMQYINSGLEILLNAHKDSLQAQSDELKRLAKEIDDWNELQIVSRS